MCFQWDGLSLHKEAGLGEGKVHMPTANQTPEGRYGDSRLGLHRSLGRD